MAVYKRGWSANPALIFELPRTLSHLRVAQMHVVIWNIEQPNLPYMYTPIVRTLETGFVLGNASVTTASVSIEGMMVARQLIDWLHRGDMFIWVGIGSQRLPWTILRRRGVHTVHYKTEPSSDRVECRYNAAVQENWEYTLVNTETWTRACANDTRAPRSRYVPPGAYADAPSRQVSRPEAEPELLFFGNVKEGGRHGARSRCFAEISTELPGRVSWLYSAFSESAFLGRLAIANATSLCLNLHKACGRREAALEAVRIAQMASAGCSVLSERAHPRDEAEYAGVVHFADNVSAAFLHWATQTSEAQRAEGITSALKRFRERFSPAAIFERAGLYVRFNLTHPQPTASRPSVPSRWRCTSDNDCTGRGD